MAEENKEAHEMLGTHYHVLEKKDGTFSVIEEKDEDKIVEISDTFENEEDARKFMDEQGKQVKDKNEAVPETEETKAEEEETKETPTEEKKEEKRVEIVDMPEDSEEPGSSEEIKAFEEELSKMKK